MIAVFIFLFCSICSTATTKDTIDFLCLTCDEDSSESEYTECCTSALGLDYCCSDREKGVEQISEAAGFFNDLIGNNNLKLMCTKNDDCPMGVSDSSEKYCCWGGECCDTHQYMNEGMEAFFRSFGGYVIGSILLGLIFILFFSLICSVCCCICRKR